MQPGGANHLQLGVYANESCGLMHLRNMMALFPSQHRIFFFFFFFLNHATVMMQKALCDLRLCLCREHPLYVPSLHVGGNVFLLCHLILADMQQQQRR